MADEHLQRGASGHLLKTATGHLANTCGVDCDYCSAPLPANITGTLSGITACACDPTDNHRVLLTLPGSVVMAAQPGFPTQCIWKYTDNNAATYEGYQPANDCPTGTHNDVTDHIDYILAKTSATIWTMRIRAFYRSSPVVSFYDVFYDQQTVAADNCDLGVTFTNDWVIGDCWVLGGPDTMYRIAYGGTVTI